MSPLTQLIIIIAIIAACEVMVMFILAWMNVELSILGEALLDSTLLAALASPPLWWAVARPLRNQSRERLRLAEQIVEQSPSAILIIDSQGGIQFHNPSARAILGPILRKTVPRIGEAFPSLTTPAAIRPDPFLALEGKKANGTRISVEGNMEPLVNGDGRFLMTFHENTDNVLAARRQALQYAVTEILSRNLALAEAASLIAGAFAEKLGASIAEIWIQTASSDRLGLIASAGPLAPEFQQQTRQIEFREGEGLPGLAWSLGRTLFIENLKEADPSVFKRIEFVKAANLDTAWAAPIRGAERHLGAIVALLPAGVPAPEKQLLEAAAGIGGQLGQYAERKWLEEELALQQAKMVGTSKFAAIGEMAGGIAHEINNPLAVILLLTSRLNDELSAIQLSQVQDLLPVLARISRMVERISKIVLGLRRISRGDDSESFSIAPLRQVLGDALEICTERFRQAGVELRGIDTVPDIVLRCRPIQLSQVFLNLLNNAFDAVQDREERWISLEAGVVDGRALVQVTDSGDGIPEKVQAKIFQPFFTTKELGKGTGIGLSISRAIVKQHGGTLELDAKHPHTRFVITLPSRPT